MYATSVLARVAVFALAVAAFGCTRSTNGAPATPRLRPEQADDAGAIAPELLARFARLPTDDFRQEITLSVRDDVAGKGFSGRGVVAVRPRRALRMILLGPGGTTAMDAWIADERWRIAIPAMDRVFRGDATSTSMPRGLPVPLLRRWLVEPFGGRPVAIHRGRVTSDGSIVDDANGFVAFLRRSDVYEIRARETEGATVRARAWWLDGGRVVAWLEGSERLLGDGPDARFVPSTAHYVSIDPPMTVEVNVGDATLAPLPDATFDDPDAVH